MSIGPLRGWDFLRSEDDNGGLELRMKIGTFKIWRSPLSCWLLFGLFAFLLLVWQFVDVKPYRGGEAIIGTAAFGAAAIAFLLLALRSSKSKTRI